MTDLASASEVNETGVNITINGVRVVAPKGELVIDAAERNGVYIPRFCYHPRMEPVGMCRQCLVEVDTGRGPGLQPSCMLTVSDDMTVDTESETTKRAQEGMLEFLLVNHPLDCPVCDKGGECPLQDQTLAFGPGESRFVEEKRHYEKPIPISDLVYLDRERCILCDRCTRFAKDIAGDPLIHFMHRGNETQVLTFPDDPFNSYFSGNTVQICPVGALTARPYRFRARPWDLAEVESTCTTCSVGCRVAVQSSRNELLRYEGVDIESVNHGWLCDKGRFGFESVNSDQRLAGPYLRDVNNSDQLVGTNAALEAAATAIGAGRGGGGVGVIGGARLNNESAYAWSKLARTVIGTDNIDAQLADGLSAQMVLSLPRATIADATSADNVVVIGTDLKEELPVLFLRLKGAAQSGRIKLTELSLLVTGLSKHASASHRYVPGELAHAVGELLASNPQLASGSTVVVIGRPSAADFPDEVEAAVGVLTAGLPLATFLPALRRGNVMGALDMGLSPGVLPGRVSLDEGRDWFGSVWSSLPGEVGLDTAGMLEAAAAGRLDTLVLLGADPLADVPDRDLVERAFAGVGSIVAIDNFVTESVKRANVVLASTAFAEVGGTTTNLEGRVSRLGQMITPPGTARADWMIAAELAWRLGGDLELESLAQIWSEIEAVAPSHAGCTLEVVEAEGAIEGVVVPIPKSPDLAGAPSGPASIRWSAPALAEPPSVDGYSLRLVARRKLYDAATNTQMAPSLANLAEQAQLMVHPGELRRLGVESGTRVNVTSSRTTVVLSLVGDAAMPRGLAVMGLRQPGLAASELIDLRAAITELRIESR
ncbi:MAG: NADH-quinone oxidoreductase subunit NuoG [Actinobacteria bacterium]|nr:NADH-quinone oxidoreductase subunit NuoG [Actinomycetota bacterium]